ADRVRSGRVPQARVSSVGEASRPSPSAAARGSVTAAPLLQESPNCAVERTAGSHSLAAAAHRER
ncbi:MAG: hypothetical protein Q7J47_20145, partial [Azoarcus sp.]|nr:hypothetical protein [Azoarcus sp.]